MLDVIEADRGEGLSAAASAVYGRATGGPWVAARIYALAGLAYAAVALIVTLLASNVAASPTRVIAILWVHLWPAIMAANLVLVTGRWTKLRSVLLYVAIGALIGANSSGPWSDMLVFWLGTVGPPALFLIPLLHPRLRAVGPLVFAFMVLGIGGMLLAVSLAMTTVGSWLLVRAALLLQLAGELVNAAPSGSGLGLIQSLAANDILAVLGGTALLGFVLFGVFAWYVLGTVGRLYQSKLISDQSVLIDLIWLIFTINLVLMQSFQGLEWSAAALLSFVAYKVVAVLGFRYVARRTRSAFGHRLLLLRVFGFRARSERLISLVGSQWRYVGSIQLIAATDLASTTVEPHEFLDFARGKLGGRYVTGRADLERQLATMDVRPDADGRFRVNEFFCHDDTWKMTLSRLAAADDLVLMDLRGFSPANQGCSFELHQLVDLVPLSKVVLILDLTTDVAFLREVLDAAWTTVSDRSPNRDLSPARVVAFHLHRDDPKSARLLLAGLAEAIAQDVAVPTPAPATEPAAA